MNHCQRRTVVNGGTIIVSKNRKRPEVIRAFPTPKPYHKTMEMVL